MSVDLSQVLQVVQLIVLLGGFGGLTFSLGRVFGRIERLEAHQLEVKSMLTGGADGGGIFLRRAEAELMLQNASQAREAFDRRLEDLAERVALLEAAKEG